ncbi:amidase family protein [Dubosiella newyorkensis]|uniref:Amidase domain-containing protein n=1 Tax=Dubosiella newyorkensis TaxID=1862672 RepID=A0A1U7NLA8_9FIRM|nr:amidase family protein [Dubosiella newyorkensis]OLU45383.1 hypothetical protein BO225_08710 [Dubosiella newyorkensis]
MSRVKNYAKKTLLATLDPGHSIDHLFMNALDSIEEDNDIQYMGVKNVRQIPTSFIQTLIDNGFALHTYDGHSHNGRAIDYARINPITGKWMTGSSSGSAINVFYGINDLGIGTDGGGSVLAPALAVNCFGFISPLLAEEKMKRFTKKSTDGIEFYPSLGFISNSWKTMVKAIEATLPLPKAQKPILLHAPEGLIDSLPKESKNVLQKSGLKFETVKIPCFEDERQPMIEFLSKELQECDVFLNFENKVDFYGLGDSVLGHFDQETKAFQNKSGKTLIRVANMVKATALCVPAFELSSGFTLYCSSSLEKIADLLKIANTLRVKEDELIQRYFRDTAPYFEQGLIWNH